MAQYGMVVGLALLVLVTGWALLLARKAAANVRQFRAENHEIFVGRSKHGGS